MPPSTSMPAQKLELAVYQSAPRLRDMAANLSRIADAANATSADLIVTPELSLTGYDLRDDVHNVARPLPLGGDVSMVWDTEVGALARCNVLVGAIERDAAAVPYNAAALLKAGRLSFVHRKIYLPTYGMFDEGRYFGRGTRVDSFVLNGWRFGVLICEDFWHPMLAYLLALQGVHALLVMAAAPGRGVWNGGEEEAFFASSDSWERIARSYAQLYGVYVVVCNRCGVEGGVTFGGESIVVAPDAGVVARAGIDEELLTVNLDASVLEAARTPYAHIRDEDAALTVREIQRIVDAREY